MAEVLLSHLSPSRLIVDIMVICMIIGAIDHLIGNKMGLASSFTEGFEAFASLAVSMSGILVLVPIIEKYLIPPISPIFDFFGIDPSILAGAVLACDMGAYPLASEIAASPEGAGLGGMLLSSMMGATIVFNIPVALGVISKDDHAIFAKGILCGIITVPVGCLTGGLMAGYTPVFVLRNLIPVILLAAVISLCLVFVPKIITKVFIIFGRIIGIIATVSCVTAIASSLTGITIIPDLGDISEAMGTVVAVVLVLPGAYVLVNIVSRLLKKPFARLSGLLGVNEKATLGLLTSTANCIPTFSLIKEMDERGKVLNFAFLVSAGFVLGDHLAYCSASEQSLVFPLILGKLVGGLCALALAMLLTREKKK